MWKQRNIRKKQTNFHLINDITWFCSSYFFESCIFNSQICSLVSIAPGKKSKIWPNVFFSHRYVISAWLGLNETHDDDVHDLFNQIIYKDYKIKENKTPQFWFNWSINPFYLSWPWVHAADWLARALGSSALVNLHADIIFLFKNKHC